MFFITIIFLIIGTILWNLVIIVPMREAYVVERLGKFKAVLMPGIHIIIPFFDRIAYRHEMREQVLDIPSQMCISRDNTQIEVDGLVYLKVMAPQKASYGIEDYRRASVNLAQTTMRSEVGKLTLGQTFSERDSLNEKIVEEIDKASDPWGIKVLRYEIKNIKPSTKVIHTLEKQMEAEREKRAQITLANAEKDSVINLSVGERQESINISEGDRQKRINEAKGRAKEISLIAEATAKSIEMITNAINEEGGKLAVQMILKEKFIEGLTGVLGNADVSVLPSEMANIKGIFEGVEQISGTMNNGGQL